MQPYDYASILQAGQNLVPNSTVQDAQLAQMRAQTAQVQQQVQANQKAQSDQQAFQNDLDGYLTNPTPQATSALLLKHPSFAKQIKDSYDVTDAESRRNDMTQKVSIYSAARGGNYDLAAKTLEARINSDKVSGQDVSHDEAILTALKGGSETERKAAVGMLQLDIAGADPERFGATYGALTKVDEPNLRSVNAGDIVIDERTGKTVFESPYKPQLVQVRNADGSTSVIEYTSGGGDQSSSGSVGTPFSELVRVEGGTNPDGSFRTSSAGAIGPAQVMPSTAPEAAKLAGVPFDPVKYRNDAAYNMKLGEAYYADLQKQFGSNPYAVAAYNAGGGRVRGAIKKGGADWVKYLPKETQDYIVKTGAAKKMSNGQWAYNVNGAWYDNAEGK